MMKKGVLLLTIFFAAFTIVLLAEPVEASHQDLSGTSCTAGCDVYSEQVLTATCSSTGPDYNGDGYYGECGEDRCGDGHCGNTKGECSECEVDCGSSPSCEDPITCGDGECEAGETCNSCSDDCACNWDDTCEQNSTGDYVCDPILEVTPDPIVVDPGQTIDFTVTEDSTDSSGGDSCTCPPNVVYDEKFPYFNADASWGWSDSHKAGYPDAFADFSTTAPSTPGDYSIYAESLSKRVETTCSASGIDLEGSTCEIDSTDTNWIEWRDNNVSVCVRETCSTLGIECGYAPDGCGGEIACGDCGSDSCCNDNMCTTTGTVGSSCTQNSDCCSNKCDDPDQDGSGTCIDSCPDGFTFDDSTDPGKCEPTFDVCYTSDGSQGSCTSLPDWGACTQPDYACCEETTYDGVTYGSEQDAISSY